MNTFFLWEIGQEDVEKMIHRLEATPAPHRIIMNSEGWVVQYARIALEYFNRHKVELVAVSWIMSSALWLFSEYKWERKMCKWLVWMRHLASKCVEVFIKKDGTSIMAQGEREFLTSTNGIDESWMTEEEHIDFEKWISIHIRRERIQKMFPDIEVI